MDDKNNIEEVVLTPPPRSQRCKQCNESAEENGVGLVERDIAGTEPCLPSLLSAGGGKFRQRLGQGHGLEASLKD